eukprot:1385349-Amorphochlora_amoeboformis.AAC.1
MKQAAKYYLKAADTGEHNGDLFRSRIDTLREKLQLDKRNFNLYISMIESGREKRGENEMDSDVRVI